MSAVLDFKDIKSKDVPMNYQLCCNAVTALW